MLIQYVIILLKKNKVMRAKIIQRATTLTAAMQYTIFAQLT